MDKKKILKIKPHKKPCPKKVESIRERKENQIITSTRQAHYTRLDFIVRASREQIEEDAILFLSFFGKDNNTDLPDYKVFINSTESYINLKLEKGEYKWSQASIKNLLGQWWNWFKTSELYSTKDIRAVKEYLEELLAHRHIGKDLIRNNLLESIHEIQNMMLNNRLDSEHQRVIRSIDADMAKVPELPKGFDQWVYTNAFGFSRYIYYKRDKKIIKAYCTNCKKDLIINETVKTKKTILHNQQGSCPACNKKITYKATGKTTQLLDYQHFAIIQAYDDKTIIIRYFAGSLSYRDNYRNPELYYREYIRHIFEYDGFLRRRRYEFETFRSTGQTRWCDDKGKLITQESYLYTKNIKQVLKNTEWKYSALYQFAKAEQKIDIEGYLTKYINMPLLEFIVKLKLTKLAYDISTGHSSYDDINTRGKNYKQILGIEKQQLEQMQRLNLGIKGLRLIKDLNKNNIKLTDKELNYALQVAPGNFRTMLTHTTAHQIIKYIDSQTPKNQTKSNTLVDWTDYIGQCMQLNLDIKNTFVLFPKNLQEKHEEYSILLKAKGTEKFNAAINKRYMELERYSFSSKKLIIIPAPDADSIVKEGHILRHCVGSTRYIKDMAEGKIAIFFVRKTDEPDKPYYTLELNLKDLRIVQCRGYKNSNTTPELQQFIDSWKKNKLTKTKNKEAV